MEKKLSILDYDILKLIDVKLAKPDKTIKQHTVELLDNLEEIRKLGYIKDDRIYNLVEKACIYHDLGKLNEEFQRRVSGKNLKFDEAKEVAHNILSLYFININHFENMEDYLKVAHSVLNHHNYCNTLEMIKEKEDLIKGLLEKFNTYKVKKSTKSLLSTIVEDLEAIKIKGYLHKCDYSASAGQIAEYPNDFLILSLEKLLDGWREENKNAAWNELQEFCINNREENIIAIAQTGMGKTEAGLLWIGNTKGFFVLPLRTAINAIYDRVRLGLLDNKKIEKRVSILHSSSLEYYIRNIPSEIEEKENIDLMNYHRVGKQLSIPLNISTMDQLFDFVYKYQGYELKITTLAYSKIVIDEIQAYGPDLLAYLIYGLEKVVEHGGKVAILTATLPPFVKDLLQKNINFKEEPNGFTNDVNRHNLNVMDKRINSEDIYEKYLKNRQENKSNKILVVCNTIKEAQKLYEEINKLMKDSDEAGGDNELHILHSKFVRKDRLKRESEIIDFGKTYDAAKGIDKQNGIWISTSIVEASLDIDFDYLFTELQDLNSLFQRLGRCNRKGVKDSTDYNCFIYIEIDNANLTNGDKGFIDERLFSLSKEAISSCDGQISEQEKISLINVYLTTEKLRGSDYMRKYKEIYEYISEIPPYEFDVNKIDLRNIRSEEIIPSPVYEKYFDKIKKIEEKLLYEEISPYDRVLLRDEIKQYTVSVNPNDVKNYERARLKGQAITYNKVNLSRYKNDYIKVIECDYDEAGYKKVKYEQVVRNSNIW